MKTSSSAVGSLAAALFGAEVALLYAEKQLEALLDSLYGAQGWQDYEYGDKAIDVFLVVESEAAAASLFMAGFERVIQHDHESKRFTTCACRPRRRPW